MKCFTPTYHANNIFEIDPEFFIVNKVKVLLLDLDNTLDSYKVKIPSSRTIEYIKLLKEHNIRLIITSNNFGKRVKKYVEGLNVEYLSLVKKPFKRKLLKKLEELKINKDDCLIIGDQLLTDVLCGNNAKIRVLLTEKLVKEEALNTKFNRLIDKPIRAHLEKCGKLKNWKDFL